MSVQDSTTSLVKYDQIEEKSLPKGVRLRYGTDSSNFEFWYPSWETWQARRTLAYWISMMYLEGSTLFVIGAYYSMNHLSAANETNEMSLVTAPYFVGGIAFTLGGYAGILEVVNIPNKDSTRFDWMFYGPQQWTRIRKFLSWEPLWGYIFYFVGALFFNINTVADFFTWGTWGKRLVVWLPAFLGSGCFTAGGFLECYHNWPLNDPTNLVNWLAIMNTIGGVCFWIAASCGLFEVENAKWYVDFPYLVGSIAFGLGSFCALWMWKNEHYGLGLISEINIEREDNREQELDVLEEYGCGRSSIYQIPWLFMYILNSSASAMLVAYGFQTDDFDKALNGILQFMLCHGILLLGSVIHHIPTARPHNWLLIYMRFVMLVYTADLWLKVFREAQDAK